MNFPSRRPPVTELVYGILGLAFLRYKEEDFSRIARDQVYFGLKALAERYPSFFKRIYFTDRGGLPHSKEIEDALFRLGGVLTVENPKYQFLSFNRNELDQVEGKVKRWFDEETQAVIEKLADEFYENVKEGRALYV